MPSDPRLQSDPNPCPAELERLRAVWRDGQPSRHEVAAAVSRWRARRPGIGRRPLRWQGPLLALLLISGSAVAARTGVPLPQALLPAARALGLADAAQPPQETPAAPARARGRRSALDAAQKESPRAADPTRQPLAVPPADTLTIGNSGFTPRALEGPGADTRGSEVQQATAGGFQSREGGTALDATRSTQSTPVRSPTQPAPTRPAPAQPTPSSPAVATFPSVEIAAPAQPRETHWRAVASALRRNELALADRELQALEKSDDTATRDAARLARAQILVRQRRTVEALPLLRTLATGSDSPVVRQRAARLLGQLREGNRSSQDGPQP